MKGMPLEPTPSQSESQQQDDCNEEWQADINSD